LIASDVFAIVAGILLFNYVPSLFYILSAALIVAGLVVYNLGSGSSAITEERHILQPVAGITEAEDKSTDSGTALVSSQ
jgi:drug/metabolite transporter (DMT)-like permease